MAFKKKAFKTQDEIPEALRGDALALADGTFVVIEADAGDGEGAVKALASERELRKQAEAAAAKARDELAEATKKLEAFEASGKQTDQRITEMLEKWRADKDTAVAEALKPVQQQLAEATQRLTRYELDDRLVAAFRKAEGDDARAARALVLAKQDGWQLVDGKVVRVGPDGNPLTQTPDEYFANDLRKDLPEFFKGTRGSGGGGNTGGGGNGGGRGAEQTKPPTEWTADERRSFIEQNGPAAYTTLLDQSMAAQLTKPAT